MPFDVSGNFSRSYNFTQDRNNGIKILASRVDGEFDNFAQGMNLVFFRSGQVAMTGDLNMGLNRVIGLGDGAAANPAIKWSSDPLTGLYMAGYGRIGITAGGTQRATVDSTGLAVQGAISATTQIVATGLLSGGSLTVYDANFGMSQIGGNPIITADANGDRIGYNRTSDFWDFQVGGTSRLQVGTAGVAALGTLSSTGAITQNGQQVYHTGNFNPASYAALASSPTFTGQVYAQGGMRTGAGSYAVGQALWYTSPSLGTVLTGSGGTTSDLFLTGRDGNPVMTVPTNTYNAVFAANVNVGGALQQGGQQVWHAGNFNPASYALLSGAAFTGGVSSTTFTSTGGLAQFVTQDRSLGAGNDWAIYASGGALRFFRGSDRATIDSAGSFSAYNVSANNNLSATGAISGASVASTGAITQGGNQVWHAGNFTPSNYAALSGATFTGSLGMSAAEFPSLFFTRTAVGTWQVGGTGTAGSNDFAIRLNATTPFKLDTSGSITLTGGVAAAGAITQAGNQVWHAGNLTPGNYALLSGAAFTGLVTGASDIRATGNLSAGGSAFNGGGFNRVISAYNSANVALTLATDARQMQIGTIGGDSTAALGVYDATAGAYRMKISSTGIADFPTGLTRSSGQVAYDGSGRTSTRITDGTAAPSGGSDGDLYFQYT